MTMTVLAVCRLDRLLWVVDAGLGHHVGLVRVLHPRESLQQRRVRLLLRGTEVGLRHCHAGLPLLRLHLSSR